MGFSLQSGLVINISLSITISSHNPTAQNVAPAALVYFSSDLITKLSHLWCLIQPEKKSSVPRNDNSAFLFFTNHQSPITNHQSPPDTSGTNHQSPITNHQSPITNHQPPTTNHLPRLREPITNHQSLPTAKDFGFAFDFSPVGTGNHQSPLLVTNNRIITRRIPAKNSQSSSNICLNHAR